MLNRSLLKRWILQLKHKLKPKLSKSKIQASKRSRKYKKRNKRRKKYKKFHSNKNWQTILEMLIINSVLNFRQSIENVIMQSIIVQMCGKKLFQNKTRLLRIKLMTGESALSCLKILKERQQSYLQKN